MGACLHDAQRAEALSDLLHLRHVRPATPPGDPRTDAPPVAQMTPRAAFGRENDPTLTCRRAARREKISHHRFSDRLLESRSPIKGTLIARIARITETGLTVPLGLGDRQPGGARLVRRQDGRDQKALCHQVF